jgi:uncharacterized membrane protein
VYETALAYDCFAVIPSIHGGADEAGGGLLGLLDSLLHQVDRFMEPGNSLELFPGIQGLAFNQHPMLVHFPIAFLIAFFLLELIGAIRHRERIREVAGWMLYLGTIAAMVAAGAGLIAEEIVPHGGDVHDTMTWHGRLGLTVASLSLVLSVWRLLSRGRFSLMAQTLHLSLASVMVICLVFAADLGGLMVYQHGVGVKQLQHGVEEHHHHDGLED